MKKIVKIYIGLWIALATATILLTNLPGHHELAKEPSNIEKIIKIDLPDITTAKSENVLYLDKSKWDNYSHCCQFKEPLSEDCIKELEKRCATDSVHWKHWFDEEGEYYVYNDRSSDGHYTSCTIFKDYALVEYAVYEIGRIYDYAPYLLLACLLILSGIVLWIASFIRNKQSRK